MTLNRIQKLLFTEYSDFEDHVLLECPFAQTTRDGEGIQQLHVGLTPTKLILAKDFLEWRDDPTCKEDPVVGTLELVSMLPVEFVNLSVYRRKTRNTIKARFCNQQVVYFELAASFRREMFWNLWCERMKFLCPEDDRGSTASSEDSVGSSSSSSSSLRVRPFTGPKSWEERNLYLGNKFRTENEILIKCSTKQSTSHTSELALKSSYEKDEDFADMKPSSADYYQRVDRFGSGIDENCETSLYLPANPVLIFNDFERSKSTSTTSEEESTTTCYQMMCLTEEAVRIWERNQEDTASLPKKHKRSSGLMPFANHLLGLGRSEMTRGGLISAQLKKFASEVNLVRSSEEVRTGIPKRLLVSSVSCECFHDREREYTEDPPIRQSWRYNRTIGRVLYWTQLEAEYTKPNSTLYNTLRRHLAQINNYRKSLGVKKRHFFWTRLKKQHTPKREILIPPLLKPVRSYNTLKKEIHMDISVSSWDFDSTILSYQLTVLDRDFFLMIPPSELHTLASEKSSRNTPNIRLMIDFSDRISNLIVTEIVRLDSLKMRARLIGKYINMADKLHRLHNMHSTHSVLNGLTMPAVHRLTITWAYMRKHHYSKYKRLNILLKLYKDVRAPLYCKMFEKYSRTPPYLPSIRCMIYGLLGHLPKASFLSGSKSYHSFTSSIWSKRQRLRFWRTQSTGGSLASETTRNTLSSESVEFSNLESVIRPPEDEECGKGLRLEAAKELLKIWQQSATTYDLIESPLVREFLLKAKYLEETESFFFSQKTEPNT